MYNPQEIEKKWQDKWEEAKIRTGSYWLTNEEAIMVVFTTTEDRSIGPIIVYIDPATNYILGQSLRM